MKALSTNVILAAIATTLRFVSLIAFAGFEDEPPIDAANQIVYRTIASLARYNVKDTNLVSFTKDSRSRKERWRAYFVASLETREPTYKITGTVESDDIYSNGTRNVYSSESNTGQVFEVGLDFLLLKKGDQWTGFIESIEGIPDELNFLDRLPNGALVEGSPSMAIYGQNMEIMQKGNKSRAEALEGMWQNKEIIWCFVGASMLEENCVPESIKITGYSFYKLILKHPGKPLDKCTIHPRSNLRKEKGEFTLRSCPDDTSWRDLKRYIPVLPAPPAIQPVSTPATTPTSEATPAATPTATPALSTTAAVPISTEKPASDSTPKARSDKETKALRNAYYSKIVKKYKSNWTKPTGTPKGIVCKVKIKQSRDGTVSQVSLEICEGASPELKRSIKDAVWDSSPLPPAPAVDLFAPTIKFKIKT